MNNAKFNNLTENTFSRNDCGVHLLGTSSPLANDARSSMENQFYLNNFIDNSMDVDLFSKFPNSWNNGSMGNYWMDYTTRYPNASEIGQTGIGDIPYIIDGNIDNYPLMYPWGVPPEIEILNAKNASYIEIFPLNFTVNKPTKWIGYSLNGEANVTVAGNVTLTDLEIGLHNVTVYAKDEFGNIGGSETFKFTMALVIHVLSPEMRTYDTSSIPLNFTVNSALAQITYCLNGEKNVTISGNTTLNGLTNGDHNVTVYVMDKARNLKASETIYFNVEVPFPVVPVVAAFVATVAVACVGVLQETQTLNK
jgi:parallel beta-helix repeat protein